MQIYEHENSDGWLLLGIIYASDMGKTPIRLQRIIAMCDYIEHAIITYAELKGGLCRLTGNNYIQDAGNLIFLPSSGIIAQFVHAKKKSIRADLEFINDLIAVKNWETDYDYAKANKAFDYDGLTVEIYREAVQKYLNDAHNLY